MSPQDRAKLDRVMAELEDLKRATRLIPARFTGSSSTVSNPYLALVIQGGNTILSSPGLVYGIKRKSGEATIGIANKIRVVRATATATITGGAVSAVAQNVKGQGYPSVPAVTVSAPPAGGTQAVITATIAPSFVDFVYIEACGTNYTSIAVSFSAPSGGGVTATGTPYLRDGKLVGIAITNPGTTYATAPTITITGTGSSAIAKAVLAKGTISLAVTTPGTGYVTAPTVSVAVPAVIPSDEAYPEGVGIAKVAAVSLYATALPTPAVNSQVLVVHDDRGLVAYGLIGDGADVPLSRPPDGVATWYQTVLKLTEADASADGVIQAWVPMFGGV